MTPDLGIRTGNQMLQESQWRKTRVRIFFIQCFHVIGIDERALLLELFQTNLEADEESFEVKLDKAVPECVIWTCLASCFEKYGDLKFENIGSLKRLVNKQGEFFYPTVTGKWNVYQIEIRKWRERIPS